MNQAWEEAHHVLCSAAETMKKDTNNIGAYQRSSTLVIKFGLKQQTLQYQHLLVQSRSSKTST
jgi:hypothetical protein